MEGGSSVGVFVDQKRLGYLSQGSMTVQQCLGEREGGGGGGGLQPAAERVVSTMKRVLASNWRR